FDLLDLLLHAVNHVKRILSGTHDNDSAHRISFTIEVCDASANVGAEAHFADVFDAYGCAGFCLRHDRNFFDVFGRLGISAAPNPVLTLREFHQPSSHIVVVFPDGLHDHVHGDSVTRQLVWIDCDLVLPDESSDGGDFGDAGYALKVIAQIPVLIGSELGQ